MAKGRRAPQEINASSMADIAFLLLVFFLVTTTMDTDWGLLRKLPPPPEDIENEVKAKQRNIFEVLVNSNDQLLVEGDLMDISQLKDAAKEFIENPANLPGLPEKKQTEIPLLGTYMVSKQVISLQNDRGTSYEMYVAVQDELAKAYHELRNDLAMRKFSVTYDKLVERAETQEEANKMMKAIKAVFPSRISEAEPKDVGGA